MESSIFERLTIDKHGNIITGQSINNKSIAHKTAITNGNEIRHDVAFNGNPREMILSIKRDEYECDSAEEQITLFNDKDFAAAVRTYLGQEAGGYIDNLLAENELYKQALERIKDTIDDVVYDYECFVKDTKEDMNNAELRITAQEKYDSLITDLLSEMRSFGKCMERRAKRIDAIMNQFHNKPDE